MAELEPSLDIAYTVDPDNYWGGWQLTLKDIRTTASAPSRAS